MPRFTQQPLLLLIFISFVALAGCASSRPIPDTLPLSPPVKHFAQQVEARYQVPQHTTLHILQQAKLQPQVVQMMKTPHEAKPWYIYRQTFLTPARIAAGVAYWHQHANTFASVEKTYGVPPEIILGILGVETFYGHNQGKLRVLDTLSTLAFYYPPRTHFFQSELAEFIALAHANRLDPTHILGSYAGAFGQTQFMPSSYRRYAKHYQGEGYSDLSYNPDDAIASIANYLNQCGWQPHSAVIIPAKLIGSLPPQANRSLKPNHRVASWQAMGVMPKQPIASDVPAALIVLAGEQQPEIWLGLNNFYVISRYNPLANYVMAVYQLAEAIRQHY